MPVLQSYSLLIASPQSADVIGRLLWGNQAAAEKGNKGMTISQRQARAAGAVTRKEEPDRQESAAESTAQVDPQSEDVLALLRLPYADERLVRAMQAEAVDASISTDGKTLIVLGWGELLMQILDRFPDGWQQHLEVIAKESGGSSGLFGSASLVCDETGEPLPVLRFVDGGPCGTHAWFGAPTLIQLVLCWDTRRDRRVAPKISVYRHGVSLVGGLRLQHSNQPLAKDLTLQQVMGRLHHLTRAAQSVRQMAYEYNLSRAVYYVGTESDLASPE